MLYTDSWYTSISLENIKKTLLHHYIYSHEINKGIRIYMKGGVNRRFAIVAIINIVLSAETGKTKIAYLARPPYLVIASALLFLAVNLVIWILCALGRAPLKFCAMFSGFYILIFGSFFWQVKECVKRFREVIFRIAVKCE